MEKNFSLLSILLSSLMLISTFSCCIYSETDKLIITGSNTVLPIAQACADSFMDKHPNVDIQISGTGSSVGFIAIGEGNADIALSSREAKKKEIEKYPSLKQYMVAYDGIAIIVHPSNKVSSLSIEQLRGIYNGTFRNWKDLGGEDKTIIVYSRDSASGTREFFKGYVMKNDTFLQPLYEKNSHAAIKKAVSQTASAIGYVGLGFLDKSVKVISIFDKNQTSGVLPSTETIRNGSYPLSRGLYFYTMGNASGLAKEFIDYVLSIEGQIIVEKEGFVAVLRVEK
jgi:phosphate transport system substrate-binding protein